MRILITGITGFVGGHLVEALLPRGDTLFGLCRRGSWSSALTHLAGKAELLPGEITDGARVEALGGQPDRQERQLHPQSEEQGRVKDLEPQRELLACGFLGLGSHQRSTPLWTAEG